MATTSPPKPAPLGCYRNPYEFLRAADEEQARALAELKKAGTLTHQAVEELRQEHRRALSLAEANHRGRIRALAWHMLQTRCAAPMDMQRDFLAVNHGGCTVLSLVSLIAAEVTANDYPHDLPFHPDALELADAIRRNHIAALQIVKDRIRTGALPVRAVTGLPVACNDAPAVLAWCNDLAAVTPPRALCTTLADARAFVQAAGLNPLRELAGESAPPSDQVPELAPPSEQVPNVPAEEVPADLEATAPPLPEPAYTSAPSLKQLGKDRFIRLRNEGESERKAEKRVHAEFGKDGLSRASLQRAWKDSRSKLPTALDQLSVANARK